MSATSPSRHRPISFVGKWLDTIEETAAPQSTSYPGRRSLPRSSKSNLTGSTLVGPRRRQYTGISLDTRPRVVYVESASPRKSRKDAFRAVFHSWKATLTTRTTSHEAFPAALRDNPELAIAELSSHLSANFAVLIEAALRNSPSKALSARQICKEIMRADHWYRAHKKFGWQECVARELSSNPVFQPVIECRQGRVRNKGVKWQLTAVDPSLAITTAPWRAPRNSVPYPLELSTEAESTERQMEQSRPEGTDTPQAPRPSLAALATASVLSSTLPLHPQPAEDPIAKKEALVSFTALGPSRSPAIISYNDAPPPSHQSGENVFRPDKADDTEGGSELPRGRGSNDEQKHPGRSDGNENRKRQRLSSPERTRSRRKFACVYHKYDPITYSSVHTVRYRTCMGPGFKYVSELSRHLERSHQEYVCAKCLRHYDNVSVYNIHAEHCIVRPSYSQEQGWEMLWRFRFPHDPVPDDIYISPVPPPLRPQLPRLNIPESLPVQVDNSARPSPASSTAATADLTPADTSSTQAPTPSNSSDQQSSNSRIPITEALKTLVYRIQRIEERLSTCEENTTRLLQKCEMPSGHGPNMMIPTQMAEASLLGGSIYSQCIASDGSMLSPGSHNPSIRSNSSLSNCPPLGSSTAVTTGTPSENTPSEELFSPDFDVHLPFGNPENLGAGATDTDADGGLVEDSFMPDLDFEAWNEEHIGAFGSVPSFVFSSC